MVLQSLTILSLLFAFGNLYRRQSSYKTARHFYERAKSVWTENGQTQTHVFMGACLYKLGCIALDIQETEIAM